MGGLLCKAHQHPKPLELTPVGNEGQVVRRSPLKQDIVEARFQVQHADPVSLHKLCLVPSHVIELVLVLGYPFIDWDYILAYPVKLLRLNARY